MHQVQGLGPSAQGQGLGLSAQGQGLVNEALFEDSFVTNNNHNDIDINHNNDNDNHAYDDDNHEYDHDDNESQQSQTGSIDPTVAAGNSTATVVTGDDDDMM